MTVRILFFGTPQFASVPLMRLIESDKFSVVLVITQPDKPSGRGKQFRPSAVKEVALQSGIPVLQPDKIRKDIHSFLKQTERFGPFDIGVVVAFGQILPREVLSLPRAGCINVHASLLPRWRGAAPIHRALMSEDAETGVCLMQMDEGLDTGPVFVQKKIPIAPDDTTGAVHDRLAVLGADLLEQNLGAIAGGSIVPSPQAADGVTYAVKISPHEASVRWNEPAHVVRGQINGLSPFPGAFSFFSGKRIKILRAAVAEEARTHWPHAGRILRSDHGSLEVACNQGSLYLLDLQAEGRSRMPVEEFLRGTTFAVGDSFSAGEL